MRARGLVLAASQPATGTAMTAIARTEARATAAAAARMMIVPGAKQKGAAELKCEPT